MTDDEMVTDDEIVALLRTDSKLARVWRAISSHNAMLDMAARHGEPLTTVQRMRMEYEAAQAIVEVLDG